MLGGGPMKFVYITERYDSSVTGNKVYPTPLDAEGSPIYAIYMNADRAQALIDAGVAAEYTPVDSNVEGTDDSDVNEGGAADSSDTNDSNADDVTGSDAADDTTDADNSSADGSEETNEDAKPKSNSKKNKSSK